MPKVIQVIESEFARGAGHQLPEVYDLEKKGYIKPELACCRMIKQYHSLDGQFLAERDDYEHWSWDITQQKYIKVGGENDGKET